MENLDIGKKLMLGSMILSLLSLCIPWADTILGGQNGFVTEGYLLLLLFVYPLIRITQNKSTNRIAGTISGAFGILIAVFYIFSFTEVDFWGIQLAKAGIGVYVYIISMVLFLVGLYKEEKQGANKEEEEEEEK